MRELGEAKSIRPQESLQIIELLLRPRRVAEAAAELLENPLSALRRGDAHRVEARPRIERALPAGRASEGIGVILSEQTA